MPFDAVVSVVARRMNTAFGSSWPSRVSVPVRVSEVADRCTPGGSVCPPRSAITVEAAVRAAASL
ncbi:MAG: hypothetical protein JWP64_4439 [Pseudonocardia sp.]|jgi:hypothetical protein|nr:hypothetical protein [Pseudonocardia sp.]MDT7700978.1 hypothetical protein [Pseudonocardiales bacterium]